MRNTILIVDDVEINRDLLCDILEDEYKIIEAGDGVEAVEQLNQKGEEIAVVLLDLVMDKLDGFGVLEEMTKRNLLKDIPVLVITSETSAKVQEQCLEKGAADFITKPFVPSIVRLRVKNNIELYNVKNNLEEMVEAQTHEIKLQNEKLYGIARSVIDLLGIVVEYRDEESGVHVMRVRSYTKILLHMMQTLYPEYGITDEDAEVIEVVSVVHDTGKIGIPDAILQKPGRLTPEEFDIMKSHTSIGYELIDKLDGVWDDKYNQYARIVAKYHHEKWDGKGYPEGLSGNDIPIAAQIVSLADVYDALTHRRVYKEAYPPDKAFAMILAGECGVFNPDLMDCFLKAKAEILEVDH